MYAIFLDIDGTIFDRNVVSQPVIDAIDRARSCGHKVFINTARGYVGMPKQIYDLDFDGFVNSSSLEVCLGNRFIHRKFIPTERAKEIARFAFENHISLCLEGEVRIDINRSVADANNTETFEEVEKILGEKSVCKLVVDTRFTDEQKATLFTEFTFHGGEVIFKGYDKAFGIKLIEKELNIPHQNTVAIGDTGSDISMIEYAGIGIAMGNCTPDLKARAKYITKHCSEDGVKVAIDCLLSGDVWRLENKEQN